MKSIPGATAICALLFCAFPAHSQVTPPKYQIGLGIGGLVYQGDLTPRAIGSYETIRPMLQLYGTRLLGSSFGLRGNIVFGALKGDDAKYAEPEYRRERNFNFRSPVLELSALGEWNLLGRNYAGRGAAPYLFAGVSFSFISIDRDYSGFNAGYFGGESGLVNALNADLRRNPPRSLFAVPVGAGIRYYLNERIGVGAETSYRLMSNDYLDGFSLAANPSKGDHFYSHTLGLFYRVGRKDLFDCPVVKY